MIKRIEIARSKSFPIFRRFRALAFLFAWGLVATLLFSYFRGTPIWDQASLLQKRDLFANPPVWNDGVTSIFLVQLIHFVSSFFYSTIDLQLFDSIVRSFAALIYLAGFSLLLNRVIHSTRLYLVGLGLILISRFPFLWLSSELFLSGFFMLANYFFVRAQDLKSVFETSAKTRYMRTYLLAVLSIVLAGGTKPDAILICLAWVIVALSALKAPSDRRRVLLGVICFSALLYVPGWIAVGFRYFSENRAFSAFIQHYGHMIYPNQLMPNAPDPWVHSEVYQNQIFADAHSFFDVISKYRYRYVDFLGLSLARSVYLFFSEFHFMALFLLFFVCFRRRIFSAQQGSLDSLTRDVFRLCSTCFISLLPILMFAYLHTRYMSKFAPVLILFSLAGLERALSQNSGIRKRLIAASCIIFGAGYLYVQCSMTLEMISAAGTLSGFYFRD